MNQKNLFFRRTGFWLSVMTMLTAILLPVRVFAQSPQTTDLILKVETATPVVTEGEGANGKTVIVTAINTTGADITGTTIAITWPADLTVSGGPVSSESGMTVSGTYI